MAHRQRRPRVGGGFRIGEIPSGTGQLFSSTLGRMGSRPKIARPKYEPIDMGGITALTKRLREADEAASNPLGIPGVAQALSTVTEGLNRQYAAQTGEALSRAAQSGQAGFAGALSQTAGALAGELGSARSQAQSSLMMEAYNKARAEGLSASEALTAAQADVARIKNERSRIDAELSAQEAQLQQEWERAYRNNLIEQARLAEQARQFNISSTLQGEELSLKEDEFGLKEEEFGLQRQKEKREQGFRTRAERRQERLDAEARRREEASLLGSLSESGILEEDDYLGRIGGLYPTLNPLRPRFGSGGWRREFAMGGGGFGGRKRRKSRYANVSDYVDTEG